MTDIFFKVPKNALSVTSYVIGGKTINCLSGSVYCDDILNLSNEPNVRDVNTKAPVIGKIVNTCLVEPEMMVLKNSGITATADSFEYKKDSWVLHMKDSNGILNGGHSWYAVGLALRKGCAPYTAQIKINILESKHLTDDDVVAISTALNDSSSPSLSTLAEKLGLTNVLKESLLPSYREKIEWKENSKLNEPCISLDNFLMLLNLMDIRNYSSFDKEKGKRITKGVKTVVKDFTSEKVHYDYMQPILNDILKLHDCISSGLTRVVKAKGRNAVKDVEVLCVGQKKQKRVQSDFVGKELDFEEKYTLFEGLPYTYNVNKAFMYVILSAFRANLTEKDGRISWVIPDVCAFYQSIEPTVWRTLVKHALEYSEKDNMGRIIIDASAATKPKNAVWDSLFTVVSNAVYKELTKRK